MLDTVARPGGARRRRRASTRRRPRQRLVKAIGNGPAEGALEDGHLDDPVLPRRPDLRGRRARAGPRRPPLHRHPVVARRRRLRAARPRGAAPPRPRLARGPRPQRARHVETRSCPPRTRTSCPRAACTVAPRRRAPHVGPRDVARLQRAVRGNGDGAVPTRAFKQRVDEENAQHGLSRPARPRPGGDPVPLDEVEPTNEIVEALLDRRDEPRRALARGARDAGDRDEPHRRRAPTRGEGGEDRAATRRPQRRRAPLARSSRSPRGALA